MPNTAWTATTPYLYISKDRCAVEAVACDVAQSVPSPGCSLSVLQRFHSLHQFHRLSVLTNLGLHLHVGAILGKADLHRGVRAQHGLHEALQERFEAQEALQGQSSGALHQEQHIHRAV